MKCPGGDFEEGFIYAVENELLSLVYFTIHMGDSRLAKKYLVQNPYFWPRGFADAVLGTAYLLFLLLLLLLLENFFEIHEKSGHFLHC